MLGVEIVGVPREAVTERMPLDAELPPDLLLTDLPVARLDELAHRHRPVDGEGSQHHTERRRALALAVAGVDQHERVGAPQPVGPGVLGRDGIVGGLGSWAGAVLAAFMFALYGLLTRYAARKDSTATSFFWTGTTGAVLMTVIGAFSWEPMTATDWQWMAALCVTGASGHWLLIKTYEVAEASAVQPFAYLQLVFASAIGIFIMGETLRPNVALGAAIVVGAGLFTLWRTRQKTA